MLYFWFYVWCSWLVAFVVHMSDIIVSGNTNKRAKSINKWQKQTVKFIRFSSLFLWCFLCSTSFFWISFFSWHSIYHIDQRGRGITITKTQKNVWFWSIYSVLLLHFLSLLRCDKLCFLLAFFLFECLIFISINFYLYVCRPSIFYSNHSCFMNY